MKMPKQFITTSDSAEPVIHQFFPAARTVRYIENGYDNFVAIIDEAYAMRFPRSEAVYSRAFFEKTALQRMESIKSVTVPKLFAKHTNPACSISSFIDGEHLTPRQVRALPDAQQKAMGQKIAEFAYEMHSALSVEEALAFRKQHRLEKMYKWRWDEYFERYVGKTQLPDPYQDAIAKQYYNEWKQLRVTTPRVVLHDDLHTQNMIFIDNKLQGVIDFDDINVGIPEQEFRQLYRINNTVLQAAVEHYNHLSGLELNVRAIQVLATMQELAAYAEKLTQQQTTHPAFQRAVINLNWWHAINEWGKGFKFKSPLSDMLEVSLGSLETSI